MDLLKAVFLSVAVLAAIAGVSLLAARMTRTLDPSVQQAKRVGESPANFIYRWHDDEKDVTCWTVRESVSCLRD